jgi:hypothetical protein
MVVLLHSIREVVSSYPALAGRVKPKKFTSLAFQKIVNVISLVSINLIKHRKEANNFIFCAHTHSSSVFKIHVHLPNDENSISNQVYHIVFCWLNTLIGMNLYRATHAVTWGLSLIRRNTPFNLLLQLVRGCVGPILPRILTVHSVMVKKTLVNNTYNTMYMHDICIKYI